MSFAEDDPIAAGVLGLVEGNVGACHQSGPPFLSVRHDDADTGGDARICLRQRRCHFCQGLAQPRDKFANALPIGVGQENGKFFAADPADDIRFRMLCRSIAPKLCKTSSPAACP